MRKTPFVTSVLCLAWIGFQAWPIASLARLARALEAKDFAHVMRYVDAASVSRSLNDQIVETYFKLTGKVVSPWLSGVVVAATESVTDPIVAKMMPPEALTEFLRTGWPSAVLPERPSGTVGLSSEQLASAWQIYWNSRLWFRRFEIALPPAEPPERRLGFEFQLTNWRWRLVRVRMPETLRVQLAEIVIKATAKP